jgi:L-asparaginase
VTFYRSSVKRHTAASEFDLGDLKTLPKVDILYSYVQPNAATIPALVNAGVTGLVFAGTGAGGMSENERDALNKIKSDAKVKVKPVVVRSARVGSGRVIPTNSDKENGTVAGDSFQPQKARILLMLALTKTRDIAEIQRMFMEY